MPRSRITSRVLGFVTETRLAGFRRETGNRLDGRSPQGE